MSLRRSQGGEGGSVRRARELMEAGLTPDHPLPLRQVDRDGPPRVVIAPPTRLRQPMPPALSASMNGGGQGIGVAISRPTQVPQWPLAAPAQRASTAANDGQPAPARGPAPQRPPRPSHVPSMLDGSRVQEPTPAFQYAPQQSNEPEQEGPASDPKSPVTSSSRPSTQSSFGSIPDFPVPVPGPATLAPQARRSANLGPPPSARRGASSYYSNTSYVSPIQEEGPRTQPTHESYASSAAMPSEWQDDTSDFDDYDDGPLDRYYFQDGTIPEEGRDSRQSNGDDSEERNLIRSASIGRRGKPAMVTTRGQDRGLPSLTVDPPTSPQLSNVAIGSLETRAAAMRAMASAHANGSGVRPSPQPVQGPSVWSQAENTDSPLAGGTGLIDASSSDSASSVPRAVSTTSIPIAISTDDRMMAPQYTPPTLDPRVSRILHAHQAASGARPGEYEEMPELEQSLSKLPGHRRPPKLDLNVVRDAEARGSLTSLPDLIRRATRLAGMIDRGKRPGSRLNNLNDFDDVDTTVAKQEPDVAENRTSTLSGMLAAFPSPGLATPRDNSPHFRSYFPSTNNNSTQALNPKRVKPDRRCCGLPLWVVLFIALMTIGIIAAAVIIPVFLLVINKNNSTTTQSSLAQCQQSVTCLNGGTNILASDLCSCICANGFTGSTCATASASGCTSMNISGTNNAAYSNVTLGDAIPRLVSQAQANFSIPLSSTIILAHFSAANLSCDAENALVTFDGQDRRMGLAGYVTSSTLPSQTAAPAVRRGTTQNTPIVAGTSYITTSSVNPTIMVDTGLPPSATGTASFPGSTPSSTPPSASAFTVTEDSRDFARVAVLYILQEQNFDNAVSAQNALQDFLSRVELDQNNIRLTAGNLTVLNGNVVNFLEYQVHLGSAPAAGG